uniref:Uncharacterized protein n=1 Tax=Arundo donax TaxID=35708 RepID=A0A0A9ATL1_ARUDO
MATIPIEYDG